MVVANMKASFLGILSGYRTAAVDFLLLVLKGGTLRGERIHESGLEGLARMVLIGCF